MILQQALNAVGSRRSRPLGLVIAATSLGFALVQFEVSILNVALARMGQALGTGMAGLQWVVDAYAITFASLLLSAGALGDRIGARRAYVAGFVLFVAGSIACGAAPSAPLLIAARAVQGAGAAFLVPCSLALLTHACGDDAAARARAIGIWTATDSAALALGPMLGGVLVDTLGWRSIFIINLPIGAAGIWLTQHHVAETRPHDGGLDAAGQVPALLTLLVLTAAVIEGGRLGFADVGVLSGLGLSILLGAAFLFVEYCGHDPMLPLSFFRHPAFSSATLIGLVINLTLYGVVFVFGLYLQQVRDYSPIKSGFAFLPFPVVLGVANLIAGRIAGRIGLSRTMAAGLLLAGVGYFLLRHLGAGTAYTAMLPGLVLLPAGIGIAVPSTTSALLATVPRTRSGVASGVLNTVRQSGGGLGVALFGALMAGQGVTGIDTAFVLSACLMAIGAGVAILGIRRAA